MVQLSVRLALIFTLSEVIMPARTAAQTLTSPGAASQPFRPVVGEAFPDLVLPSLEDGRPVSLAEFRGKKVILHVFASW